MDAPDSIHVEPLDGRAVAKRQRRFSTKTPSGLELLPGEWRDLLARWARRDGKSKWETLLKDAGTARMQTADSLRDWLVREGWAEVIEERRHGDWWPLWLELRELPALRAALGLSDKETDARRWENTRAELAALNDEALFPALIALDKLPVHRALARCGLVFKLHEWKEQQQTGTRRNFAHFARDATKRITEPEWDWLEATLDLAEFGIKRHTPLLLISAPLALRTPGGLLDLAAFSDFAALTPAVVQSVTSANGVLRHWHLLENRTNFEYAARNREPGTAVVWLPGFPPGWWQDAMAQLLAHAPAPARISCDPDPAGIAIALQAAEVWRQRGLAWEPWQMAASDLAALRVRIPLTDWDAQQLTAQMERGDLPPQLADLAAWLMEHREKGEQEGYL